MEREFTLVLVLALVAVVFLDMSREEITGKDVLNVDILETGVYSRDGKVASIPSIPAASLGGVSQGQQGSQKTPDQQSQTAPPPSFSFKEAPELPLTCTSTSIKEFIFSKNKLGSSNLPTAGDLPLLRSSNMVMHKSRIALDFFHPNSLKKTLYILDVGENRLLEDDDRLLYTIPLAPNTYPDFDLYGHHLAWTDNLLHYCQILSEGTNELSAIGAKGICPNPFSLTSHYNARLPTTSATHVAWASPKWVNAATYVTSVYVCSYAQLLQNPSSCDSITPAIQIFGFSEQIADLQLTPHNLYVMANDRTLTLNHQRVYQYNILQQQSSVIYDQTIVYGQLNNPPELLNIRAKSLQPYSGTTYTDAVYSLWSDNSLHLGILYDAGTGSGFDIGVLLFPPNFRVLSFAVDKAEKELDPFTALYFDSTWSEKLGIFFAPNTLSTIPSYNLFYNIYSTSYQFSEPYSFLTNNFENGPSYAYCVF